MTTTEIESQATVKTDAPATPQKSRVSPRKPKAASKTTRDHMPCKTVKKAKPIRPATASRPSSKTSKVLDMLKRPNGATLKELMKATGWQPHSVRGFLSGTVGKKMKLTVASSREEDGERCYSVKP
jgi:hypothetical protein